MDRHQIRERVARLGDWFHNMNLGGVETAPNHFLGDYPRIKWERFAQAIPADLTGRTVLDVGCNGGFYAIEMKRRGAGRVLAVDTDERYLAQARLAAEIAAVDIEFERLSVYELPRLATRFDLVFFMGVLYHLRHPLLARDLLAQHVVGDVMVFQSMLRGSTTRGLFAHDYDFGETQQFADPDYPVLHFVEHRYAGDQTNWWIPNLSCAEAMLRSAGFTIESQPETEVFICRLAEGVPTPLPGDERLVPWLKP
jgi:tRNA (mo5U34)-methyltransferase